jgi:Ankyrin repeats (3 copies)/Ankyrin repeat
MPNSLPSRPDLEQLRKQAKDLLKSHKGGNSHAVERFRVSHPRCSSASVSEIRATRLTLTDAQLVIAREYGFDSWPKLKEHVLLESGDPHELLKKAFQANDAPLFRKLLDRHPEFKARINEPIGPFDSPAITRVRTREMLDVLLEAGADINAKSRWWAGGFGLLHSAEPSLAAYAIQRGAVVDVHAAARLGMIEKLRELFSADPALVHARGGDGQTPLHFASTIEIAGFLLDHGADIDARDVDHESTPAQYMLRDRQDIARYLIQRGCGTDILMAAALGDSELVRSHLDADPDCIHTRVSDEWFPMIKQKSGGTIYQWTLGFHVSAHDVARQFGHDDVVRLLMERSPADVKLLAACWAGDEVGVQSLLAEHPGIVTRLAGASRRQVAHAARNNNFDAVRLMLAAGLPVDALGQHRATPLHWAAFHGNVEMAREILRHDPPLELTDADFNGTPLGWAIHGSEHGWYCRTGNYPATVEVLLAAGAKPPEKIAGTPAVQEALRRYEAKG